MPRRTAPPTLPVESIGSGIDVVLLHGWGLHSEFFRPWLPALTAHCRVHLIDLPGHGQSSKPQTNYTMDFFAEAVLAVVPRKGARFVAKTLHSAIANAENNNKLRPETLRIKEAVAGTATTLKRFQPKARGSAGPILKRRCHIKITLSDE